MNLRILLRAIVTVAVFLGPVPSFAQDAKAREIVEGYKGEVASAWISRYYAGVVPKVYRRHLKLMEALERRSIVIKEENGGPWLFKMAPMTSGIVLSETPRFFLFNLGRYQDIVVISVGPSNYDNCDIQVNARFWLEYEEVVGYEARLLSGNDWLVTEFCFIYGRNGLELASTNLVF